MTEINDETLRGWAQQLARKEIPETWEHVSSSAQSLVARNRVCDLYFKAYFPRSRTTAIKHSLRGGRLQRASAHCAMLRRYGFDAPKTVLHGKLPRGGEYAFMQTLGGRDLFLELLQLDGRSRTAITNRRRLMQDLGTFLGRLHATGFAHGKPGAENIITRKVEGRFHFALINAQSCKRQIPLSGRRMLHDLRALNTAVLPGITARDRLRFLRAWRAQMHHLSATDVAILLAALNGKKSAGQGSSPANPRCT